MTEPYIQHSHIAAFADEKVNLKRDDVKEYREQVNRLRARLKDYIKEHPDYNLVKMLHSGSVRKGTALKTLNDMDVGVYIRPSEETSDESRLLSWLIERLKEVYPTLKSEQFTRQNHCVTISFQVSGLNVYEDDPDDRGYLITKDTGDRVLTSIPLHLEFIRKRKEEQRRHFAQVVRLIKWWIREKKNAESSFRFKSFMVELLCAHLADNGLDMSNYPLALEYFFTYIITSELKERISFTDYYESSELPESTDCVIEIFGPVNPENNVASSYTVFDQQRIIEAAHDALDALTEAHYSTTKGRAVKMWQFVLGSSFKG
jgi:tRNA nucleotidyltransferase (CCA-adding enzyme)